MLIGMKSYYHILEAGGKNVTQKSGQQLYDRMWNNFFNICIISSVID